MAEPTAKLIRFEIGQIDELLTRYEPLVTKVQQDEPDLVELTALASVLHSFFTGVENIFVVIAQNIDGIPPSGPSSHRDLLNQMVKPNSMRTAVLSSESAAQLAEYLAFRHFYRHAYSFFLRWAEMEGLVIKMSHVWRQVRHELMLFLEKYDRA